MGEFEEGYALLEQKFGNGKDNIITLGTIALQRGESGRPLPVVRGLDAYYEDGVFYVSTNAQSVITSYSIHYTKLYEMYRSSEAYRPDHC